MTIHTISNSMGDWSFVNVVAVYYNKEYYDSFICWILVLTSEQR